MSKYVKYISSAHYGAPEMKGDRFGYLVEMLRTVLCAGFNERTDVTSFEVISNSRFKAKFTIEHHYSLNQTIKFSNTPSPELTGESVVYKVDDPFTITLDSYSDLSGIVGSKYENLWNVSSIVAPLGFIEKFQDEYRSVFTTDEEKAFLYIDDTTPDNWMGALDANRTPLICPIVYMTDKKDDIDTDGRFILPYGSSNPTWYKDRSYLNGTNKQNGIWNWITYGLIGDTSTGNDANQRSANLEYTIVGNGRMFYFIPSIQWNTTVYPQIYYFGKINSDRDNYGDLPYVLNSAPYISNVYNNSKLSTNYYWYAPTNYNSHSLNLSIDIGQWSVGVLNINGNSSPIYIKPTMNHSALLVSGSQSNIKMTYPDVYTKRLYTSKLKVNDNNGYIGNLSGLLFVNNINPTFFPRGVVKDFNTKKAYVINSTFNNNISGGTGSNAQFIYFISLDYKDWYNYE